MAAAKIAFRFGHDKEQGRAKVKCHVHANFVSACQILSLLLHSRRAELQKGPHVEARNTVKNDWVRNLGNSAFDLYLSGWSGWRHDKDVTQ